MTADKKKACRGCNEIKALGDFHRRSAAKDGRQGRCKVCATATVIQWQRDNPERHYEKQRRHDLKRLYGITPSDRATMLESQAGACAICRVPESSDAPLYVDHCHDSGRVRGLLCYLCNIGIGRFKDDVALLARAATYLDR
jgi:hypothetical protein